MPNAPDINMPYAQPISGVNTTPHWGALPGLPGPVQQAPIQQPNYAYAGYQQNMLPGAHVPGLDQLIRDAGLPPLQVAPPQQGGPTPYTPPPPVAPVTPHVPPPAGPPSLPPPPGGTTPVNTGPMPKPSISPQTGLNKADPHLDRHPGSVMVNTPSGDVMRQDPQGGGVVYGPGIDPKKGLPAPTRAILDAAQTPTHPHPNGIAHGNNPATGKPWTQAEFDQGLHHRKRKNPAVVGTY